MPVDDGKSETTSWSPSPEEHPQQEFSLQLMYYLPAKGKRGNPKAPKKEACGKDLLFLCKKSNHLEFLKALLSQYNENKYKVTVTQHFPFKYYYPGRK
jgi:hypothetical protein